MCLPCQRWLLSTLPSWSSAPRASDASIAHDEAPHLSASRPVHWHEAQLFSYQAASTKLLHSLLPLSMPWSNPTCRSSSRGDSGTVLKGRG
ncbi:hypothetical protein BKA70DRAFT_503271 [Coprinopsis sp. MPI-PUGE-AT-0042]|nr:hypothetical protein BKA70DRAFT_503271 [Coprinopsis sp. MPI-PUGE-AT-0042]